MRSLFQLTFVEKLGLRKYNQQLNEEAIRKACEHGHIENVKSLLALEGDRKINVHANDDEAFRMACRNGRTEVVKLLLSLEGDRKIPESCIPWEYLPPKTKPTKNTCIVSYEPIEENEEYVECVVNPEHVVKNEVYKKTGYTTCVVCRTNNVQKYKKT